MTPPLTVMPETGYRAHLCVRVVDARGVVLCRETDRRFASLIVSLINAIHDAQPTSGDVEHGDPAVTPPPGD